MRNLIISVALGLSASGLALADDRPDIRKEIECTSGKDFAKMAGKLAKLGPDKTDTVNTNPSFTLATTDGGDFPTRLFVRSKKGETDLTVSEEGEVKNFLGLFHGDKSAELCVEDPSRAGQVKSKVKGEGAYSMSMQFNINFLNPDGTYSMVELEDGMKDGKSALKKIVPGPVALVLPKMSHLFFEFEDENVAPKFTAYKGGEAIGVLEFVELGPAHLVAFETLEEMQADELRVEGGVHTLSPSMGPKRMAKIMGLPEPE